MDNIFLTKLLSTFPHLKYSHIIFIIIIHWKRTHFSIYFIKAETTHISLKSTRSIKNITIINNVLFASFFHNQFQTNSYILCRAHTWRQRSSYQMTNTSLTFFPFWIPHISKTICIYLFIFKLYYIWILCLFFRW